MVQSRQRLQQRRQSIVAARRASIAPGSSLPTPPAYLHQMAAAASANADSRTSSQADVRDSQACSVQ